ncbi:hypothetical protein SAMN02745746_01334 [Pseudogulbenkiania subflava DSM 22618]|uniref:Uncharacterized protein n=1 Tax=Pseudogulbenkiania subflava DSM 22618 TaxID=1123014 RepID=A0A1Y6BMP9_9NEIS|nr:hypothetical protein SAMN02745746_01334 [Pseudogulbenkiania subflava DSM 22618]
MESFGAGTQAKSLSSSSDSEGFPYWLMRYYDFIRSFGNFQSPLKKQTKEQEAIYGIFNLDSFALERFIQKWLLVEHNCQIFFCAD